MKDLTRIFNTALVSTRTNIQRDLSSEIHHLVEKPAFRAILKSISALAEEEGLTEREAACLIIETFRESDRLWLEYILQQGVARLQDSN